jgi:hypothetical protein
VAAQQAQGPEFKPQYRGKSTLKRKKKRALMVQEGNAVSRAPY